MDLVRKFLLLVILGFSSAQAAINTSMAIWEKSYTLERQKKFAEAENVIKPALEKSPHDQFTDSSRLAKLSSSKCVSEIIIIKPLKSTQIQLMQD